MNAQHFVRNASGDRGDTMAEIFARTSDHSSNGDVAMTDAELLQHYIERERIIHAGQRTPGHYRLRNLALSKSIPSVSETF